MPPATCAELLYASDRPVPRRNRGSAAWRRAGVGVASDLPVPRRNRGDEAGRRGEAGFANELPMARRNRGSAGWRRTAFLAWLVLKRILGAAGARTLKRGAGPNVSR